MRRVFEDALRRVVSARSVEVHETSRWRSASDGRRNGEVIALDIGGDDGTPAVLEATFDPGRRPGEWDLQVLGMAAHVAALVVEIERTRARILRAGDADVIRRPDAAAPLVGSTAAMSNLRDAIARVAKTDLPVLLEGERGVGKELIARQIHDLSARRHGPFVQAGCSAFVGMPPETEPFDLEERTPAGLRTRRGRFEAADGGTLFVEDVSDLSLTAQATLLRTIQGLSVEGAGGARRADARIIAATNRPLAGLVAQQLFRADLYYRLTGVDVRVPPLRERRDDILELAGYFLQRHQTTRPLRLSLGAADALVAYDWPENVRELERFIERAVAVTTSNVIELDDLPAVARGDRVAIVGRSLQRGDTMRAWGSRYAQLVLERCGGNKRKACRALRISYHTLQAYLRYRDESDGEPEAVKRVDQGVEMAAPD